MIFIPYLLRVYYLENGFHKDILYFSTETRIDELMMGCGLAYYFSYVPRLKGVQELLLSALMIVCFASGLYVNSSVSSAYLESLNYTLIGLASVLLIVIALRGGDHGLRRILKNETMARLGVLSYGVYLLHPLVIYLVRDMHLNVSIYVLLGINTALSFAVAYPFFFQFEQRFARLKTTSTGVGRNAPQSRFTEQPFSTFR